MDPIDTSDHLILAMLAIQLTIRLFKKQSSIFSLLSKLHATTTYNVQVPVLPVSSILSHFFTNHADTSVFMKNSRTVRKPGNKRKIN